MQLMLMASALSAQATTLSSSAAKYPTERAFQKEVAAGTVGTATVDGAGDGEQTALAAFLDFQNILSRRYGRIASKDLLVHCLIRVARNPCKWSVFSFVASCNLRCLAGL